MNGIPASRLDLSETAATEAASATAPAALGPCENCGLTLHRANLKAIALTVAGLPVPGHLEPQLIDERNVEDDDGTLRMILSEHTPSRCSAVRAGEDPETAGKN